MPVFLDLATRLDRESQEKAAKEVTDRWVSAANDISKTVGGVLSKMFDGVDGSKARNELKSLQDEYAKLARDAGDAERRMVSSAGNVEVAIKRLHDVHDKYGAAAHQTATAENRVVDAWARSSQAALDAAAAADVASEAHKKVEQAASGASTGALAMNTSMILAAGGIAAAGVAAYEAGRKLFDMGQMWADVSDEITYRTGKIGEDVKQMADQIADVANKTAAPIQRIGDVFTELSRLKDLKGDELNDLTKQISDFDQMNKDAPVNVRLFTRTMQEFHVPTEQLGKDFDTLNTAAQTAQMPMNELLQTLHDAGPSADIAGLSFGQMVNVLGTLEESGVNVDTALKGLRMGLGNIAQDSAKLQKLIKFAPDENELQRLKDVIQKIQELHHAGDDVGAIDLGKTVFGRSWTDLGQAIIDDKLNVEDLNTSVSQIGPTVEQQRSATKHFGDDWQIVKNQITDGLKPLSEHIFDAADRGLQNFAKDALLSIGDIAKSFHDLREGDIKGLAGDLFDLGKFLTTGETTWHQQVIDSGAGHGGASGREHRGLPEGPPKPGQPATTSGAPTGPNINTTKPYYPLDLNPADKPPGYETMDTWIASQKAVRSALDRQADTGFRLAEAQQRQQDLLDSGKATQEQLNTAANDLATAERDNKQATDDVADAKRKYVEDANKTKRGRDDNPFDSYDPFKEATKHSTGLVPQLTSLLAAFAANQAFGNPYGKLQAIKRGEDPSNPLYVSDVNGTGSDGKTPGGLLGGFRKLLEDTIPGAKPGPQSTGGGAPSPPGSIPWLVQQGQPGSQPGSPSAAPPGASAPLHGWWTQGKPQAGAPTGAAAPGDTALTSTLKAAGFSPQQIRLIQAFSQVEGLNPAGNPTLGFSDAKLGGDSSLQGHVNALAKQFKDRSSVAGAFPEGGSDQQLAEWIAKVVGQPLSGINPPDTGDYVKRIVSNLSPTSSAPTVGGNPPSGMNLSTIPVAVQKYANDCIDASARIILSHSGVNMTEDQLEGVIAPGGSIDSQAAGLNKLDPQGKFVAMQGSGGSQQAMFNAIKASIDSGVGSILNVAPGSSIAGRPFGEGHFIAVTGYNPDGTINLSDTARGTQYSVSAADAFQATQGRGIVAGTGTGPAIPTQNPVAKPGGQPQLPGILSTLFNPPAPGPAIPWQLPGFATGGEVAPSDTVPAMLTPKEFVVNKDAAQAHLPELQAMNAGRPTPETTGPAASSRQYSGSSSVTPPPPGPRVGQGTGAGFGVGGGLIGLAEQAAMTAAMGAAGFAEGGEVPDMPTPDAPGGGGAPGGSGGGGASGTLLQVLNRTVGYIGQLGGIAAQGLMSSLIPGASQKGGIMDGGILSRLAGGIAGAHPSAPNTAGKTPTPLPKPDSGQNSGGGDVHNHIGTQAGVNIGTLINHNGQSGQDLANDLAFKSYAGYGSR